MTTRNVTLTLEKAREWFNSDSMELKEVALQAFTKEELTIPRFKSIKTFENAIDALGWDPKHCRLLKTYIEEVSMYSLASAAMIKLSIIRKALNLGENMEFTKGDVYYPYNPFITESSTYYNDEIKKGSMSVVAEFKYKGQRYRLVGGHANDGSSSGLGAFASYDGVGYANSNIGFLGCATREIAQHFGRYFAREIFDAKYGDTVKYQWIK